MTFQLSLASVVGFDNNCQISIAQAIFVEALCIMTMLLRRSQAKNRIASKRCKLRFNTLTNCVANTDLFMLYMLDYPRTLLFVYNGSWAISGRPYQTANIPVSRIQVQPTPVALTFDRRSVVPRIGLAAGVTLAPSLTSHAAAHHRLHLGFTTPRGAERKGENGNRPTRGNAAIP
jgi:hypothetical protein